MTPWWSRWLAWIRPGQAPEHLRRGQLGEDAAAARLSADGARILVRNYTDGRGEIDLIISDQRGLAFVEVKTRSSGQWLRPAAAVNRRKRQLLGKTALHYLRAAGSPRIPIRFDIVEVLLQDGVPVEIRHLRNAFSFEGGSQYP